MLHRIWLTFIVSAFLATLYQALWGENPGGFQDVMNAVSSMATEGVPPVLTRVPARKNSPSRLMEYSTRGLNIS